MGLHWDYRFVVGDKAYSFATKKEMPEPGKAILLFEQPVHDAAYALSERVEIPKGQYGAGTTTLDFVHKARVGENSSPESLTMYVNNGQKFLLKKVPDSKFGKNSWLFKNLTKTDSFVDKLIKMAYDRQVKYVEKDWRDLQDPVGSKKYDGAHYTLTVQPTGEFTYHSRLKGVNGTHPEKSDRIPHLNDRPLPQYAGAEFSVELIHTGFNPAHPERHNLLSGILNSLPERAVATQEKIGPVRAVLLNVKKSPGVDLNSFEDKISYMQQFAKDFGKPDLLFPPNYARGKDAIQELATSLKKDKQEGVIVTSGSAPEQSNIRYKEKNFQTYNLKISGFQQEQSILGQPKPQVGAFKVSDATNREVAKCSGMDHTIRKDAYENPSSWIGKLIQVKALPPLNPGGRLRSPVYNGDADGNLDTVK